MYSYTVTGINNIHAPEPNQPQLRIRCKCQRNLIQEQIYTCISCAYYCCHYCTIPDILFFQCRNCKFVNEYYKANTCKVCFSCPYCSNVLVLSKSKDKKFVMMCMYCYWNTKEIQISAEKSEDLIDTLNKLSSNMRETEYKIYNATQGLFKEVAAFVDHENQALKYSSSFRKPYKKSQEDSLLDTKNQIEKTCEALVKRVGLEDPCQEYDGELKLPQNLPLQAKKARRCPNCKKPLTTTYRTRTGEQKTELMYKDLKMLQCQIKPPVDNKVKIKCLRDVTITIDSEVPCKVNDIKEVEVNEPFKVSIDIVNKARETTSQIEYDFIVLAANDKNEK